MPEKCKGKDHTLLAFCASAAPGPDIDLLYLYP
jgi:hypothetical protein